MNNILRGWVAPAFFTAMLFMSNLLAAYGPSGFHVSGFPADSFPAMAVNGQDTIFREYSSGHRKSSQRFIHRLGVEGRPAYVIPTNSFLKGENEQWLVMKWAYSAHLKYSFAFRPDTYAGRIYGGAYQGAGLAYYNFDNPQELGNPVALYLFQGGRIAKIASRLSFNYEWNFGVSFGWKPYDFITNSYNKIIGSKVNAYLNTNFYLDWMLSRRLDVNAGITLTHFSNGNTNFPNSGLNSAGLKLGVVYNFNRENDRFTESGNLPDIPQFNRHISYDLVLFGSWRRKGITMGDQQLASPESYTVMGFSFAPMYNFGYKFRAGISLDGVWDESANLYSQDYISGTEPEFFKAPFGRQFALGLSARAEFVMPYFTVGFGMGGNVLHGKGDLKAFYQTLALKIEVTRSSFLHIGYNLLNFHTPNFLMLGVGFRFNNKYPAYYR